MANLAIDGLGRIGRAALKILLDTEGIDVVAVNDVIPVDNLAYLLRFDTVYGRYHRQVAAEADTLVIDGRSIPVFGEKDPAALPRSELGVVLILECTGDFREEASSDRSRDVLSVSEDALVSSDIVGDPRASVVDLPMTRVVDGSLVKVMSWYDNEWGFTHQMIRAAKTMLGVDPMRS